MCRWCTPWRRAEAPNGPGLSCCLNCFVSGKRNVTLGADMKSVAVQAGVRKGEVEMLYKVGIIGVGGVGGIHAAILARDSRVKLQSFF